MEEILQKALAAVQKGQNYAFATVTDATLKGTPRKAGAKMLVLEDGSSYGTIGGGRYEKDAIQQCLKAIKSGVATTVTYDYFGQEGQSVCGGQIRVFIEPVIQPGRLIICGAGHIALPLSAIGKILRMKVLIVDNRKNLANKRRFPHVDRIVVGPHAKGLAKIKTGPDTFIMIVTQGNEYDFECLKQALTMETAYIGCISSKAKKIKFFGRLKKMGFTQNQLNRICIPAGVDCGAQTPEEIAVSIAAEIISHRNRAYLGTAKFKDKGRPVTAVKL